MSDNFRILSPVGQGGFDIENIDGTTIVFDCGSYGKYHVENCIHHYREIIPLSCDKKPIIDYVFLSHFDNDHINGLPMLKKHFIIKNIVVPYIPKRYRVLYNVVTKFCVSRFYKYASEGQAINIIESKPLILNQQIQFLKGDGYGRVQSVNQKWEWICRSYFSIRQWEELIEELENYGFHLNFCQLSDDEIQVQNSQSELIPISPNEWTKSINEMPSEWKKILKEGSLTKVKMSELKDWSETFDINSFGSDSIELSDIKMKFINKAIGRLFGQSNQSFAKNENGLVMLSKKTSIEQVVRIEFFYPVSPFSKILDNNYSNTHNIYECGQSHSHSACIYTGDMKLGVEYSSTILDFIKITCEPMLLFQIPHHGSSHNSSGEYLRPVPASFFFWHDRDSTRIRKNVSIMTDLGIASRLRIIDTTVGSLCTIML